MPRIFFVNRFFYPDQSATSQILSDLVQDLGRRGQDVLVVCSRQLYDAPSSQLPATDTVLGATVHRVWTTRFGRNNLWGRSIDYLSFYLVCGCTLLLRLRSGDTLIAKTDPPLISIVCSLVARARGARLINWQQDVFPEVASALGESRLLRPLGTLLRRARNSSLRMAAMNVVIGTRMRDYLARQGIPAGQLCVIENWAHAEAVHPQAASASALRTSLGLVNQLVVGYSGNLGRAHEFDTLLAAAEALASEAFTFLIIGGGARMDAFKRAVENRGLSNFRFLPYQPREALDDSLAASDVHVVSLLPQLEGFIVPSKFYGILAAGRPVIFIGDPDGELARVIRASHCGVVVDVAAAGELASQLRWLREQPECRMALGKRARQLLDEQYSAQLGIDKWCALITALGAAHTVAQTRE